MYGHGKETVGGAGGGIVHVTSLADSGPGTLREALGWNVPRTIKFDVSGIISFASIVFASSGFCTLDAMGKNICIRGAPLRICSPEWIIRNIRFRPGDIYPNKAEGDGLSIAGINPVYNIYIENCSFSWAQDEIFSVWGGGEYSYRPHNITVTNCIIAEALRGESDNSYGVMLGHCDRVALVNNVIAYNRGRSPFLVDAAGIEIVNNDICYWGYEAIRLNGYCEVDIIGNRFVDNGPAVAPLQFAGDVAGKVYTSRNSGLWYSYTKHAVEFPAVPVASSGDVEAQEPLTSAGAFPRDTVDARIVYNIENGLPPISNSWSIDSQEQVGGWSDMTTTKWTGNIETVKPLRDGPAGDATRVVLSRGTFVKADERVDRWIRLIEPGVGAGLWASYTWLANFQEIQETDPPPVAATMYTPAGGATLPMSAADGAPLGTLTNAAEIKWIPK